MAGSPADDCRQEGILKTTNALKITAAAILFLPACLAAQSVDDLALGLPARIKAEKTLKLAVLTFPYVDGFNSSGSRIVQERMLTALAGSDKFNLLT